jgi:guanylate kinase
MNDMTIVITRPSSSGKTSLFNLIEEKKEKTKSAIEP